MTCVYTKQRAPDDTQDPADIQVKPGGQGAGSRGLEHEDAPRCVNRGGERLDESREEWSHAQLTSGVGKSQSGR